MDARNTAFVMFLLSLSLKSHLSIGADTISADQFLSGDKTIVSSNGIFELGFFNPGKSSKYYIGIWYKNISPQTVVWVANREAPVLDKYSAELKIIDGNLVLSNVSKTKTSIWSTNINSIVSNSVVVAVLLNNGDLVLRNLVTSSTIWKSFDHPTDTWLPDGKLLFDRREVKKALTSWKNSENPAPGLFSYDHEPNGSKSFLSWNATQQYWTSGFWNFYVSGLSPQLRNSQIFNYSYVNNDSESYGYFTYQPHDPSSISRFVLDASGQFNLLNWSRSSKEWTLIWSQPKEQCDVYAYCGAFGICNQDSCACSTGFEAKSNKEWDLKDFSSGCVRKTDLQCRSDPNGKKDNFFMYRNMRLPQDTQSLMATSAKECESVCLSNCSCLAYGYNSGMCSVWTADLLNLIQLSHDDVNGQTILVKLAASEFHNTKSRKAILIGSVAALFVVSGLILMSFWWWHRRVVGFSKAVEGSLVAFNFNDLQHATKNFSQRLGGGGFGSVFKGTLHDLSVIAVKKLESISQGEKQFRAEVSTLGTIHHVNLVRLRGFCSEGKKKLLVYDYMENGSLDYHLFSENNSSLLDWKMRYQIALGTARGLAYLHEKCRDYIIHCDIKPENILLDDKFCAKLADFGLAKLVGRDFSRVLTSIRGTKGYLAPEWLSGVAITTKADVYSYGMVLFELISGRRNCLQYYEDEQVDYFPYRATSITVDGGDVISLLDNRLDRIADPEEVSRMCKVALWCIQEDEDRRPSMGQVIQILEGVLDVNVPPAPLLLQIFAPERSSRSLMKDVNSNV
ncbi:hypothetical protein K7X08_037431 [Anisodus acutangulus]|uniref:Receptor-like serine/threonine-protein kinase n=1 Tax=Anisodus acutangulus TaxID=402998 RepID=A0A9Q1MWI0_9SOLA|nr:hypothetical protein K7X08_037431 [Anisodus acutangulus]